ncbi:MAG: hypothetical protein ACOYOZ_11165 [Pirellula sp.]
MPISLDGFPQYLLRMAGLVCLLVLMSNAIGGQVPAMDGADLF